ncbi:MAG: mechanosensitive ion channel [Candidatus Cloacimonetes bacterium]|nr:mechanosensitive ion channel [Candidatus Cloacimonadota bacterium]
MIDVQGLLAKGLEKLIFYGPKLLIAIVVLIVGLWIINTVLKLIFKKMPASRFDPTLTSFLKSIIGIGLKVILWITVLSMLGLKMTSFVALIGAAGLAVGLALQGSLANFAGGVLIMLFKPFKLGDYIQTGGNSGTVNSIQIFNTILITPDNKTIIIPNGEISNTSLTNFSTQPIRRVDLQFGIGYGDDIKKAKEIMLKVISSDERILSDPAPQVALSELGDSSVNFVFRIWCTSENYWGLFFDMQEKVKLEFDANGISIPFPQRDVHIYNH